jgi:hypothetical protein
MRQANSRFKRPRKDDILALAALLYPFVYGYSVLSSSQPIVVNRAYLYLVKPFQLILLTGGYLWLAQISLASLQSRHKLPTKNGLFRFPLLTISIIPIVVLSFADIYKYVGLVGPDGLVHHDAVVCLYFSVVTWTTLGYGDFRPGSNDGRIFASFEALLGYIVMGVLVGAVAQSLYEVRLHRSRFLSPSVDAAGPQTTESPREGAPNTAPPADG